MAKPSKIADLQLSIVQHLQSLPKECVSIDLHSLGMKSLDFAIEALSSFKNLQFIDLHDNIIEEFPDLHDLEQLRLVDFTDNPLSQNESIESIVDTRLVPPLTKIQLTKQSMIS